MRMRSIVVFASFSVGACMELDWLPVSPISLSGTSSLGCSMCCNSGQCQTGYQDSYPAVCCAGGGDPQCCPTNFNGRQYHCQSTGGGQFGCAPGSGSGYQSGGYQPGGSSYQNYHPPPPPPPPRRYQPPPPPPPPRRYQNYAPAPQPKPLVCNRQTGGTCKYFGCSSSRGPTDCVGSFFSGKNCVCQDGYCAFDGKCIRTRGCDTTTPGTCKIMGCKSSRGDVKCEGGNCVCKPGACAVDGKCTQKCDKATGGSCHILGCSSKRNARCESGACVCGPDDCSWNGQCVKGTDAKAMWTALATNMTTKEDAVSSVSKDSIGSFPDMLNTYLGTLPDLDDPILLGFVGAFFSGIAVSSVVWARRRSVSVATEPLLG